MQSSKCISASNLQKASAPGTSKKHQHQEPPKCKLQNVSASGTHKCNMQNESASVITKVLCPKCISMNNLRNLSSTLRNAPIALSNAFSNLRKAFGNLKKKNHKKTPPKYVQLPSKCIQEPLKCIEQLPKNQYPFI